MAHFKMAKEAIRHWRSVLVSLARTGEKRAELGGDGQDVQFEQAFSNLAHAYLKDKAPSLLQYELGFQLLERNQDNTKAVGVFGFKIGPQLVYAPAFFLNGELKGHELLYLKDQDQFVPLKENWINYILNKKPNILGEGVDKNLSRLGITQPNLRMLSLPPTKFGAAIRPELLPGAAAFAHFAVTNPYADKKYEGMIDLETFLKKEGEAVIDVFVRQLMSSPKLAEKFANDFDGMAIIRRAIEASKQPEEPLAGVLGEEKKKKKRKSLYRRAIDVVLPESTSFSKTDPHKDAAARAYTVGLDGKLKPKYVPKAHQSQGVLEETVKMPQQPQQPQRQQDKKANLRIVTITSFEAKSDLSPREREILLRDGVLFIDNRTDDEISESYRVQTPLSLTNPTETGVYDILVKPGEFEKCLVVFSPHTHCERKDWATVVRIEGPKNWINIHPSRLWTKQQGETDVQTYDKWLGGLPEVTSLSPSRSAVYMIVGPRGQASTPFRVKRVVSDDGALKVYDVCFEDWADGGTRPRNLPPIGKRDIDFDMIYGSGGERIVLTGKTGGVMKSGGNDLYVPKGFKLLTIKEDKDDVWEDGILGCCSSCMTGESDPPPIVPGNQLDLQRAIFENTTQLKLAHTGTEVQIDGVSMSPIGGLIHLVRDWGLRAKVAKAMLKEAEAKRVVRYHIKLANPLMTGPGPSAPGFPDPSMMTDPMAMGAQGMGPVEQTLPVDMPAGDPYQYAMGPAPDPQAVQAVMQAAQTGQKEVLDTAAIGSILKAVRDDTMIDRHLGDLMRGLDKLGRILFSFYWHGEDFQERYGKQDMPELEDGLRNAFEMLGDVVLFLKQKTIEPFPDETAYVDLSNAAS